MKKAALLFIGGALAATALQIAIKDELGAPSRPQIEAARVQACTEVQRNSQAMHKYIEQGDFTRAALQAQAATVMLQAIGEESVCSEIKQLHPVLLKAGDLQHQIRTTMHLKNQGASQDMAGIDVINTNETIRLLEKYLAERRNLDAETLKPIEEHLKAELLKVLAMVQDGINYAEGYRTHPNHYTYAPTLPADKYRGLKGRLQPLIDALAV